MTQNEIDAANAVRLTHLNSQGQPIFEWPATFALARAYLDQLERHRGLDAARIAAARDELSAAEGMTGPGRASALRSLADALGSDAGGALDSAKVEKLADAVRRLAEVG